MSHIQILINNSEKINTINEQKQINITLVKKILQTSHTIFRNAFHSGCKILHLNVQNISRLNNNVKKNHF
jgi:hypothetical protein